MAELAVAVALGSLQIIIPLLTQLYLHKDDEDGIKRMESWLSSFKAFIEDTINRRDLGRQQQQQQQDLVNKASKIVFDIENVLDEFLLHAPPYTFHRSSLTRNVHRRAHQLRHGLPPPRLSKKVKSILKSIDDVKFQIPLMNFRDSESPSSSSSASPLLLDHEMVGYEIPKDEYYAVQLSYIDLSSSLKCCLLYMAIFPGYTVERGRLIRLWVAEGLATAPAASDKTAEEVAEGYLTQLIQRNLIHVSNSDLHGRPTNCGVQNPAVLRFIIQKCNDDNFASIFDHDQIQTIPNIEGGQMIRRLSFQNQFKRLEENGDFASVRSLFLLRLQSEICSSDFERNLGKLKLIKVMDVQGAPLTEFPKEITRFTLMRYLSFRDTKIQTIPSSIEKLSYLETLDLKRTNVTQLPKEITHLHNLCHLLVYKKNDPHHVADFNSVQGVKLHKAGIRKLEKLQTLSLVKVDPKGEILEDLEKKIQLRKLGLTGLRQEHSEALCKAVKSMGKLTTLNLSSATMQEYMELEGLTNWTSKTLERLYLRGGLKTFPSWIREMVNLVRIHLKWSKLENFPLEDLEKLPRLTELHLVDCFVGKQLTFEGSGFKKMEILTIEDFTNLKIIVVEKGAMPELKQMSIRRCREMRELLGGENLVGVELTLHDMHAEFIAHFRNNGWRLD